MVLMPLSAFAVSRGYITDDPLLKPGMVVALSTTTNSGEAKVARASNENTQNVLGIAVNSTDTDITVGSAQKEVYVQNSGEAVAYVSDIDGVIHKGDLLALSSFKGILSKATQDTDVTFGIALEDSAGKESETHTYQNSETEKTTKITPIRINFDRVSGNRSEVDSSLERLGRSIAGRSVSEIRVVAAMLIFLVILITEASILYGAISSAITSLGRNPLARKIIKHELLRVVIVAFSVLFFGLGAIYMILWI
jgi:hypothetical protein